MPKGRYAVGIEAIDGAPVYPDQINTAAIIGDAYGVLDFHEEFYDRREDDVEARPGDAKPVFVAAGQVRAAASIS